MSNASDFIIENGVLQKYVGTDEHVVTPEGVTEIGWNPFPDHVKTVVISEGVHTLGHSFGYVKDLTAVSLPASLQHISRNAIEHCNKLVEISLADNNPYYKLVDGALYDREMKNLIAWPTGKGWEYSVPAGVESVCLACFPAAFGTEFHLHLTGDIREIIGYGSNMVIHAPSGSYAERYARRNCKFVEEGEPVSADDSDERKERSLKDWRLVFTISSRKKGWHIGKYSRSSKVVYVPDIIGKTEIGSIEKDAFPPDVAILCSKRMFSKLCSENRNATIRAYLLDRKLFTEEEQAYLLAYLKKYREQYLESYILAEDYSVLQACLDVLSNVKTLTEECLGITERCGKSHMNFFFLNHKNESEQKPAEKKERTKKEKAPELATDVMSVAEGKKIFKLSISEKGITISGYKRSDLKMVIPEQIGDHAVVEIKAGAFEEMSSLERAVLPDSITKIGANAFRACENLKSVRLPEKLETLGGRAFQLCGQLSEITLPASVKKFGEAVFSGCPALADEHGYVIIKNTLYGYYGDSATVTVPEGVKTIEFDAFSRNTKIQSVQLPKSLKKICYGAFSECEGLTALELPSGLTGIASFAFSGCGNLKTINIPSGVKKLEGYTFARCINLEHVFISENLAKLDSGGEKDFFECKKLTIHAPAGSYAETYAKENNIPFVAE